MRVVLQRVTEAQVTENGALLGKINKGVLVLAAIAPEDSLQQTRWMMEKILSMRVFEGDSGTMDYTIPQIDGEILLVSQFTLYGDVRKGTRPSFSKAMPPTQAQELFEHFVLEFQQRYPGKVQSGRFGGDMKVTLTNEGPVTLIIDT